MQSVAYAAPSGAAADEGDMFPYTKGRVALFQLVVRPSQLGYRAAKGGFDRGACRRGVAGTLLSNHKWLNKHYRTTDADAQFARVGTIHDGW